MVACVVYREAQSSPGLRLTRDQISTRLRTDEQAGRFIRLDENGVPLDLWGRPLAVSVTRTGRKVCITMSSLGADGVTGTEDDVEVSLPGMLDEPWPETGEHAETVVLWRHAKQAGGKICTPGTRSGA